MTIQLPDWWVIASSIIFGVSILATLALAILSFQLLKTVSGILPKVNSLAVKVQGLSTNVTALSEEVKGVTGRLSERSAPMALAVRDIAATTTTSFARFAPLVAIVTGALNLLEARNKGKA